MLKHTLIAAAVSLALAGAASAQQPAPPAGRPGESAATSPDDCLKAAFDLAQRAETRKLDDADVDKLEEMLTQLEGHCDAKRFPEAQAMAGEIAAIIERKPAGDPPTTKE